jgi:cytochrome c peroxidase
MTNPRRLFLVGAAILGACSSDATSTAVVPVARVATSPDLSATAGTAFSYDARTAFTGASASYTVTFAPDGNGLTATGGMIAGTPTSPRATTVIVVAQNGTGSPVADTFTVYAFASTLSVPSLPTTSFVYADASTLPPHYTGGPVAAADNSPATNPVTNAGATLGRVLFYDRRLSANDQVACASCHLQATGFSDTARFSHGFQGGLTTRHAMSLGNARYYARGRFFWDERAATLEDQALLPIQNSIEMGMTLENLVTKLKVTSYYPALFQAAFGTTDITSDRIGRALAQFVRSMSTYQSKYDRAVAANSFNSFTPEEQLGLTLFAPQGGVGPGSCGRCHGTQATISDNLHNNGLDVVSADTGAGRGQFKAPSLRNVGLRSHFMHDGRFTTLRQVVEHYNSGVNAGPDLDQRLRGQGGTPVRLNLTTAEIDALVAFLNTLTDQTFASDPKFSSPFSH